MISVWLIKWHTVLQICGYLRDSCRWTRSSGVEGALLDCLWLSLRWESCSGRADCAKQVSNGGNNSVLAGLLNTHRYSLLVFFKEIKHFKQLEHWKKMQVLFMITDINCRKITDFDTDLWLKHLSITVKGKYTLSKVYYINHLLDSEAWITPLCYKWVRFIVLYMFTDCNSRWQCCTFINNTDIYFEAGTTVVKTVCTGNDFARRGRKNVFLRYKAAKIDKSVASAST